MRAPSHTGSHCMSDANGVAVNAGTSPSPAEAAKPHGMRAESASMLNIPSPESPHAHAPLAALTLAAIGIVYGDIGTSPLYALKECLSPHYGITANHDNVIGLLSLMTWALTMV